MNLFAYVSISVVLIATVILYIIFYKNNLRGYRYVLGLVISAAAAVVVSLFFPQLVSFFTVNRAMQFVISFLISIILYVTILFLVMILVSALFPAQMTDKKKQKPKEKVKKDQNGKKHEFHKIGLQKQKEQRIGELKQGAAQPEQNLELPGRKDEDPEGKPEKPEIKEDKLKQPDKKDGKLDKDQGSSDQKADRFAKAKEVWKQINEKWKQVQQKRKQDKLDGKTTKDQQFAQEKDVKDTELAPESIASVETMQSGEVPEAISEIADQMATLAKDAANKAVTETADPMIEVAEETANKAVAETADPMIEVAEETVNKAVAEIADPMIEVAEETVNKAVAEIADPMIEVAEETVNKAVAETADPMIEVAEETANKAVAEIADQMTTLAKDAADEAVAETENEIGNAYDCITVKEDNLIENAVLTLSNLAEKDENTEKNVDTSDIIDKMGIDMVSDTPLVHPELNGSELEHTIEKAFSLKQEGRQIEAATLFMEALDKEPDLETTFWIVLDLCAIYKNAGQIELAEDILLSYAEQYEDMMSEEIKEQILHSLYM